MIAVLLITLTISLVLNIVLVATKADIKSEALDSKIKLKTCLELIESKAKREVETLEIIEKLNKQLIEAEKLNKQLAVVEKQPVSLAPTEKVEKPKSKKRFYPKKKSNDSSNKM